MKNRWEAVVKCRKTYLGRTWISQQSDDSFNFKSISQFRQKVFYPQIDLFKCKSNGLIRSSYSTRTQSESTIFCGYSTNVQFGFPTKGTLLLALLCSHCSVCYLHAWSSITLSIIPSLDRHRSNFSKGLVKPRCTSERSFLPVPFVQLLSHCWTLTNKIMYYHHIPQTHSIAVKSYCYCFTCAACCLYPLCDMMVPYILWSSLHWTSPSLSWC